MAAAAAAMLSSPPPPPLLHDSPLRKNRSHNLPTKSKFPLQTHCSNPNTATTTTPSPPPPLVRRRTRYRKMYPGEKVGITEEMRFVAMRLRNKKNRLGEEEEEDEDEVSSRGDGEESYEDAWQPSVEGFVKYLVDSYHVFSTVERIVDQSSDVSYAYFRKTRLERSEGLAKDIEWFRHRGVQIPEPNNPGVTYVQYLEEIAEKSPPLFLCHFYNIYFSHIAGGQVIANKVSERILDGRELEFNTWEGDADQLLSLVREKLNMLGEHWSRDVKTKCLSETTKAFRYLGQIVRLIILLS